MMVLTQRFLRWCNLHGINPGQRYIGKGHLHQEDWAELRMKAYASRVFTAFMAVCLESLVQQLAPNVDDDLALVSLACAQLANFMLAEENAPIKLSDETAEALYCEGMKLLCLKLTMFCSNSLQWICV